MQHRQLGRSGLKITPVTLGTMEVGGKVDESTAADLVAMAVERGINLVDTANVYAGGRSEEILGRLIKPHRGKLLVSTKFSVPLSDDPKSGGTSRHAVIANCEASLKRLGTDHIDLYFIHRPFPQTPIEETLRALEDLMRAGKVRAIGSSSFASWQVLEALWCADVRHLVRLTAEQTPYHLLDRRVERELVPAARSHGLGLMIWSPLAGGLLTGKYVGRDAENARLQKADTAWGAKHFAIGVTETVSKLKSIAEEAGQSLTAMSLAWTLAQPGVTSLVLGPRDRQQFGEQLDALEVNLSTDQLHAIDKVVPFGGVTVPYYLDDAFADFSPNRHSW